MEVKTIVQEINRLPLAKRFFVMEQTLKSIKNEELSHQLDYDPEDEKDFSNLSVNEKSLSIDWLSTADNRWDKIL